LSFGVDLNVEYAYKMYSVTPFTIPFTASNTHHQLAADAEIWRLISWKSPNFFYPTSALP